MSKNLNDVVVDALKVHAVIGILARDMKLNQQDGYMVAEVIDEMMARLLEDLEKLS